MAVKGLGPKMSGQLWCSKCWAIMRRWEAAAAFLKRERDQLFEQNPQHISV